MDLKNKNCECGIRACNNNCLANISGEEFEIRQNIFLIAENYGNLSADICPVFEKPLFRHLSEEKENSPRIITDSQGNKTWAIPVLIKNCITKKLMLNTEKTRY